MHTPKAFQNMMTPSFERFFSTSVQIVCAKRHAQPSIKMVAASARTSPQHQYRDHNGSATAYVSLGP